MKFLCVVSPDDGLSVDLDIADIRSSLPAHAGFKYSKRDSAKRDFSSFKSLSKVYFESSDVFEYLEDLDINRKLDSAFGNVRTAVGSDYSSSDFYLAFAIYLLDENSQDKVSNSDPEELPFPNDRNELKYLRDNLVEICADYPLSFFFDNISEVDRRGQILFEALDKGCSHAQWMEIARIRTKPLESHITQNWEDNLNDELDNQVALRNILLKSGKLKQKKIPPQNLDGILIYKGQWWRKYFVDREATQIQRANFSPIFDDYREYILRRLTIETYEVDTYDKLYDRLGNEIENKDPIAILLNTGTPRREFIDDVRVENNENEEFNSYHSFLDTPVIREATDHYTALLLLENNSRGLEYIERDNSLTLSVTAGEKDSAIPAKDLEEIPYHHTPQDLVNVEVRLRGYMESRGLDGILISVPSEEDGSD